MKTLKNIFLAVLLLSVTQLKAQTDKATTQKIIDAQNYVFVATMAFPMNSADISKILNRMPGANSGGAINLNGSNYDLNVTKDSVVAFLPYYGRAFTARIGNNEGGIKFKSKDFTYKKEIRKKGGWIISIKPKDVKDDFNANYNLMLNVTTSGYATLTVNSNNQQPITFNGYLAEQKVKKQ